MSTPNKEKIMFKSTSYYVSAQDMEEISNTVAFRLSKLSNIENLQKYTTTCIQNEKKKLIKAKRRELDKWLEYWKESYVHTAPHTEIRIKNMGQLLSELSKREKSVLNVFLKTGCLVETAKLLNSSYNTCKSTFRHAILKLRKKGSINEFISNYIHIV